MSARKEAEREAQTVMDQIEEEFKKIEEEHKHETGMDLGAKEKRKIIDEGTKKIADIRKKYGITLERSEKEID